MAALLYNINMAKWIPVDEGLPEEDGFYPVTRLGFMRRSKRLILGKPMVMIDYYHKSTGFDECVMAWAEVKPYQPTLGGDQYL